jgi:hypothetical protein
MPQYGGALQRESRQPAKAMLAKSRYYPVAKQSAYRKKISLNTISVSKTEAQRYFAYANAIFCAALLVIAP